MGFTCSIGRFYPAPLLTVLLLTLLLQFCVTVGSHLAGIPLPALDQLHSKLCQTSSCSSSIVEMFLTFYLSWWVYIFSVSLLAFFFLSLFFYYSQFTIFCQSLLYSRVTQLYIYIYIHSFSHIIFYQPVCILWGRGNRQKAWVVNLSCLISCPVQLLEFYLDVFKVFHYPP